MMERMMFNVMPHAENQRMRLCDAVAMRGSSLRKLSGCVLWMLFAGVAFAGASLLTCDPARIAHGPLMFTGFA